MYAAGCGGTGSAARSSSGSAAVDSSTAVAAAPAKPAKSYRTGDSDVDDENGKEGLGNHDDDPLTLYGHAAGPVDRRNITALLERYYAAAAADEGAKACSLLYSSLARDPRLTKTVPEDRFSFPLHVRVLPGESCSRVTSRLFRLRHRSLSLEAPTLQVINLRVDGAHGDAVLGFKTAPEQWIPIARQDGVWKVHALLALMLP